jgi:indolepyruvate ferredoxin oxidoreductase beta subunit
MKCDVILAGVGGHGVLSLGVVLAAAARAEGHEVKLSEVHGMAQRGGSVLAHLRIADAPIESALIPEGSADLLLATEPLEALRYLHLLAPEGTVVTSTDPVRNIDDYPDEAVLSKRLEALPSRVLVAAEQLAKEAGVRQAANLVVAGAAIDRLPIEPETMEQVIGETFGRLGERIVEANVSALRAGRERAACPSP